MIVHALSMIAGRMHADPLFIVLRAERKGIKTFLHSSYTYFHAFGRGAPTLSGSLSKLIN